MKKTINILLTIALIVTGCDGPSSLKPDVLLSDNHPIEFAVSCDLSVESKAAIYGSNITSYGFKALGGLTTSEPSETNAVFGLNGTIVSYLNGAWTYSPLRYWQPGSYVFAGVMPSTINCTPSLSQTNHKQLTLDFANGFNLAENQIDLLVAFDDLNVDLISNLTSTAVDFNFNHQFSLVSIQGASVDPNTSGIAIQEIKVYGNSPATTGDMVFTYVEATETTPYTINYAYTLAGNTTGGNNVYKTFGRPTEAGVPAEKDWNLVSSGSDGELVYDILVPELIVFPQQCTFTIVITYTEDGISKTRTGSLSADWKAGKKYTYSFDLATDITFSVNVSQWTSTNVNDTPIEII